MPFSELDAALEEVAVLTKRFNSPGFCLYLVGGIVRDLWLDQPMAASTDFDLTTDALPGQIKAIVEGWADALWTQGERFGTIGMRLGGRLIEITTHRAETYLDDSRKPQVAFGDDIAVDLARRDFTVNAMAIDASSGELIDPWGGAQDLADGLLRTPLSPTVSFGDDPLRMLRAARFAARYRLDIDSELEAAAHGMKHRLSIVAVERISDEVERLLGLDDPSAGIAFLERTEILAQVLGYRDELAMDSVTDNVVRLTTGVATVEANWRLRLAVICATVFASAQETAIATGRLRLSRDDQKYIVGVVGGVERVTQMAANASLSDADIRRFAWSVQHPIHTLIAARALEQGDRSQLSHYVEALSTRYRELARQEPLPDPGPLHDGNAIMELLQIEPGAIVGQATSALREARIVGGQLTLEEEAQALRDWWTLHGP